jgi:hypothetical protein
MLAVKTETNGDLRVHMKGALPWLVHWARHAGTRDVCPALAALVGQVQNFLFCHRTLFHFLRPYHPANWAGSRAATPVYLCVSLCFINGKSYRYSTVDVKQHKC